MLRRWLGEGALCPTGPSNVPRHRRTRQPMIPARRRGPSCVHDAGGRDMAAIEDVRSLGAELERSYQVYVGGRLKFRVKQIVYVAFSLDESVMGFAFPMDERETLVLSEPQKFQLPTASDMRFNWVHADLAALDPIEARELVVDAWRMVVPKKLAGAYDLIHPIGPGVEPGLCPSADGPARGREPAWQVVIFLNLPVDHG